MRPHKNLLAWKESISFVEEIYNLTNKLPDTERFGLTSQLRRAAVSIPTNVSEGAARHTKKEFIHFLYISSGSLSEVDTLLTIASNLNYMSKNDLENSELKINKIGSLLNGLIKKLKYELYIELPHHFITQFSPKYGFQSPKYHPPAPDYLSIARGEN